MQLYNGHQFQSITLIDATRQRRSPTRFSRSTAVASSSSLILKPPQPHPSSPPSLSPSPTKTFTTIIFTPLLSRPTRVWSSITTPQTPRPTPTRVDTTETVALLMQLVSRFEIVRAWPDHLICIYARSCAKFGIDMSHSTNGEQEGKGGTATLGRVEKTVE